MTYNLINQLSESALFPSQKSLEKYEPQEISEIAYLHILALYIMLNEGYSKIWAENYCRRTTRATNFRKWRSDATDTYILMHALSDDKESLHDEEHDAEYYRDGLMISPTLVYHWIENGGRGRLKEDQTKSLFCKMDMMFRVRNASVRAVRRLVQDWTELSKGEQRTAMTRLLNLLREHDGKSELLSQLTRLAGARSLESPSTDGKKSFLASLVNNSLIKRAMAKESASGGATCAASVATSVGGLGAGFCDDYTKSVYGAPKKAEKKKPKIISRLTEGTEHPDIMYHESGNIASILKHGLKREYDQTCDDNGMKGIYLSTKPSENCLVVNVKGLDLEEDHTSLDIDLGDDEEWWVCYYCDIPPSRIKLYTGRITEKKKPKIISRLTESIVATKTFGYVSLLKVEEQNGPFTSYTYVVRYKKQDVLKTKNEFYAERAARGIAAKEFPPNKIPSSFANDKPAGWENDVKWVTLTETLEQEYHEPPQKNWADLRTGEPATIYAWRGINGTSTPLSDKWKAKLGREYLLGDGVYLAPSKIMATRFGDPILCKVILHNPYVFHNCRGTDLIGFDLESVRKTHDAVVIIEGRAEGNEDIRQICVFPGHENQIEFNVKPKYTTVQPGAKVRIKPLKPDASDYARQRYEPLVGKTGKVTSMSLGHPNVKIGGKTHIIDNDMVELIESVRPSEQYLYHTTGNYAAVEILKTGELKPKNYEAFVSLSTQPLPYGDIESRDVTLVFHTAALAPQLLEVEYDESWFHEHPEQGRYIAGEGWQEQFFFEPDEDDMDEFDIDDAEELARSDAELDAFTDKLGEDEWISKTMGAPLKFRKQDVVGLIINHPRAMLGQDDWPQVLASIGYGHVKVSHRKV